MLYSLCKIEIEARLTKVGVGFEENILLPKGDAAESVRPPHRPTLGCDDNIGATVIRFSGVALLNVLTFSHGI